MNYESLSVSISLNFDAANKHHFQSLFNSIKSSGVEWGKLDCNQLKQYFRSLSAIAIDHLFPVLILSLIQFHALQLIFDTLGKFIDRCCDRFFSSLRPRQYLPWMKTANTNY